MKLWINIDPDLSFFLPKNQKALSFTIRLERRASIKDIIESLGIPHTEIGQLIMDHQVIDFSYIPEQEGRLLAMPIRRPFDVKMPSLLRPEPLDRIRFVADINVIRLGKLLILSGFDVVYSKTLTDEQIAEISFNEKRIVLTRDTRLLCRNKIDFARRIRSDQPYEQLTEVIEFFGLEDKIRFFTRCTVCNRRLVNVDKADIVGLLEPKTKRYYNTFLRCPGCMKIYWQGSHFDHLKKTFKKMGLTAGSS